jgi:hypothetical protein
MNDADPTKVHMALRDVTNITAHLGNLNVRGPRAVKIWAAQAAFPYYNEMRIGFAKV